MLTALIIASTLLCVLTFLPHWRVNYGWVRMWDFPKAQVLTLHAGVWLAWIIYTLNTGLPDWTILPKTALFIGSSLYLTWRMIPYSPFYPVEARRAPKGSRPDIRFYIANVLESNEEAEELLRQIKNTSPDIVLLVETDEAWLQRVSELEQRYPHRILQPQSNTYGMLLYSRLPFEQAEVRFLVEDDIPSIRARLRLKDGRVVQLYALHPRPPTPLNDADERNIELWLVAKEAAECEFPVIVAGDMNDVGWSRTTAKFRKVSGLKDPRIGRGLFNTYNAYHWWMRWPLDHVFHSGDLLLTHIRRMPKFGSDHYAIDIGFCLRK